jgi:hypothetical protein
MQFKDLPALVDSIKNQVGPDQATQFNGDASAALSAELPLPEALPSVRSGHEDFERALASIPPGVRKKLKETLGAEFTVLRPSPPAGLSRPR